jgi:hypothetical protein
MHSLFYLKSSHNPDITCSHQTAIRHLDTIQQYTANVTDLHTKTAKHRHLVLSVVCDEIRNSKDGIICIGKILLCIIACKESGAVPPTFLVQFRESILQDWASRILYCLFQHGCCAWSLFEQDSLICLLGRALDGGLCHRQHISVVDQGRNPSWLCEYCRCIYLIWGKNDSSVNPETIQYLKKLACCNGECVALISDYAALCIGSQEAAQMLRELSVMQKIIFASFVNNGISNLAASECINGVNLSLNVIEWIVSVESFISEIWDTIITTNSDFECIELPGFKGSHAEVLFFPKIIATHGTPTLVLNCMNSILPLSLVNPATNHFIYIDHLNEKPFNDLCKGLVCCVYSMLKTCEFKECDRHNESGLETYTDILDRAVDEVCYITGYTRNSIDTIYTNSRVSNLGSVFETSDLSKRNNYRQSLVSKIQVAGNLFDTTIAIQQNTAQKVIHAKDIKTIWNAKTKQHDINPSVVGRFISDFKRMVDNHGLSVDIIVNKHAKTITYKSQNSVNKCLRLLLNYMEEFSKSRRKRNNSLVVKKNSKPREDKERPSQS